LFKNIFTQGGTAQLENFDARLCDEVKQIAPKYIEKIVFQESKS
jgi:actin-related protein